MKNESCLKRILTFLLAVIFLPVFIYLFIVLHGKYHTFNRSFVADIKSVGYVISFSEIEHDSVLSFCFNWKDCNMKVPTLFVYNNAWDIVSFIFTKDTIYVRDAMEFQDLFSPEEREKYPISPKDFTKVKIIKGDLPSCCKIVPYSDSRFFVYDRNKCEYVLKDSTMHIIKLVHFVERTNEYHLFDENLIDTLEIQLSENQCTGDDSTR